MYARVRNEDWRRHLLRLFSEYRQRHNGVLRRSLAINAVGGAEEEGRQLFLAWSPCSGPYSVPTTLASCLNFGTRSSSRPWAQLEVRGRRNRGASSRVKPCLKSQKFKRVGGGDEKSRTMTHFGPEAKSD